MANSTIFSLNIVENYVNNPEKCFRACLYDRRDGTFTGTGRLSSRIYMNCLQAGQLESFGVGRQLKLTLLTRDLL